MSSFWVLFLDMPTRPIGGISERNPKQTEIQIYFKFPLRTYFEEEEATSTTNSLTTSTSPLPPPPPTPPPLTPHPTTPPHSQRMSSAANAPLCNARERKQCNLLSYFPAPHQLCVTRSCGKRARRGGGGLFCYQISVERLSKIQVFIFDT